VIQSDDPRELITSYHSLKSQPALAASLRADGLITARRFAWPRILEAYEALWETASVLAS